MLQNPEPRLVLASASVVRQKLLANAGLSFEVAVAAIDEVELKRAAKASGDNAEQATVVCQRGEQVLWHHIALPRLTMRAFPDESIDDYLAAEGDRVSSSVGAYRLEGLGIHLFDRVEGDYTAILGLQLLPLLGFLRQHGVVR